MKKLLAILSLSFLYLSCMAQTVYKIPATADFSNDTIYAWKSTEGLVHLEGVLRKATSNPTHMVCSSIPSAIDRMRPASLPANVQNFTTATLKNSGIQVNAGMIFYPANADSGEVLYLNGTYPMPPINAQ